MNPIHARLFRLIGTLPSLFLNLYHRSLNSVFDNPEWNVVGFAPDMINGRECLRVSYARVGATAGGSGVKVDFWVDLARNANVIRSVIAGREVVERIDCDLGMVEGAGWFPCETQYSLYEKGILTEEEITRVRVIQFNKNVPPDEFSVASLGVPDGRDVIDTSVSPAKHFIMDKGNLVDAAVHGAYQVKERPSRSGRVWLVCGVLTGAFAFWFLWRRPDRVNKGVNNGVRTH